MGTRHFNLLDHWIATWRMRKIRTYVSGSDTVLDFGCGYHATLLRSLKHTIRSGIGIDYDVANDAIGKNIRTMTFRYEGSLPFRKGQFDKIFMLAVLEHFDRRQSITLLKEFRRVLKKGGQLIVTTPTPAAIPVLEFLAETLHIISRTEIGDHKHYYSQRDFSVLAHQTQFTVQSYETFQWGLNSLAVLI